MHKIYNILLFLGIFSLPNLLLSADKTSILENLPSEIQFTVIEKLIDEYFSKPITTKPELYNVIKEIKNNLKIDKLFQDFAQSSLAARYLKNKIENTDKFNDLSVIDIYLFLHTKGAQEILEKLCKTDNKIYNKAGSLLIKKIQKNQNNKLLKKIEFLIDSYSDLKDFRDLFKYTPLMVAAINERADIVELLIKKEADVDAKNLAGQTALDYAKKKNNYKIVELLLAAERE